MFTRAREIASCKPPEGRLPQLIITTITKEITMKILPLAPLAIIVVLMGCQEPRRAGQYPLREDLAHYSREVSADSREAQDYFDQGLVLYYGFNHEAAIASFKEAGMLSPNLAMAWWGQAISAGPNINNPAMDSTATKNAWEAVQQASKLADEASPVEQALIRALTERYAWPQPEDRKLLDVEYANAMRKVWKMYPNDADVGALFADALMNLRPWDLWTADGNPKPETPEIIATIERVFQLDPDHPGACHFYIHTMEASPTPERALDAANRLRNRIPGSGHLVHMPSHIDIRLGHYDEAIRANKKGVSIDSTWASQGGFYTLYRAHNFHFLTYAAMFEGRRNLAIEASRDMLNQIPLDVVREYIDFLDGFMAVPIHVMVRFGMWAELLREPKPPADLLATVAFWHYGRTVAYSALGRVTEAMSEFDSLKGAYDATPEGRLIGNNGARTVLEVGLAMAEGELEYRRGHSKRAFTLLGEAVKRDDALRYDEPWGWMMPVRHSLGALLLEQGRLAEAEKVYNEDLRLHPQNGWALKGLAECLHRSGRHGDAAHADSLFAQSWARADIEIKASCYCRTEFAM